MKEEIARKLFLEGYNCAQAVVGAFAEDMGMNQKEAMRLASSFGGGMGRFREVCGAVSGMFIVAGALYGYDDPKDCEAKTAHYRRIQQLGNAFSEKNGSLVCRQLLGLTLDKDSPIPEERTSSYYEKRPCVELVVDAALILEQYIAINKIV